MIKSKKRKLNLMSGENKSQIIEDFDYEEDISKYYTEMTGNAGKKRIYLENVKKITAPLYVFLNVKDLEQSLDLKKEVILTMLN